MASLSKAMEKRLYSAKECYKQSPTTLIPELLRDPVLRQLLGFVLLYNLAWQNRSYFFCLCLPFPANSDLSPDIWTTEAELEREEETEER